MSQQADIIPLQTESGRLRQRKQRGAYFTPPGLSRYLAEWAIRSPHEKVLEPSCGEASFLLAAARRLQQLGCHPSELRKQLLGVEIHEPSAFHAEHLLDAEGFNAELVVGDFFAYNGAVKFDAVVGNPPFVRYQNFSGAVRARSLEVALAEGVRISGLASSWAAFVVKASTHVAPGGRLALVLPAELLSVSYAADVRRYLLQRFNRVKLVTFEKRVFPEVLEDVVLLLAEGTGGAEFFELHQTCDVNTLVGSELAKWSRHVPSEGAKWTSALLGEEAFTAYYNLAGSRFEELRDWGSTYLGSVTGSNAYFSLSKEDVAKFGISKDELVKISAPGTRHLRGFEFTESAWTQLRDDGARCYLFCPTSKMSNAAQRYIQAGVREGVSKAYKCRVRSPWWRVPLVKVPDLFLTYMNDDRPRLIANTAGVHILNSVYGIALSDERRELGRELLPLAALNTVTLLGAEIVGRAYGGGLLKMEPREADNLPMPSLVTLRDSASMLRSIRPHLSTALRQGDLNGAAKLVDPLVLNDVPAEKLIAMREAREELYRRRRARSKRGSNR